MCESCRFDIIFADKNQNFTPTDVARFVAKTLDLIAKPLTSGYKLPIQFFQVKNIIHGRLPDEITLEKHNDSPWYLNFYLRYIKALKDQRYPLNPNPSAHYERNVNKLTEQFGIEQKKNAETTQIALINEKTWT